MAQIDPDGAFHKVCDDCYYFGRTKPGPGYQRDLTRTFQAMRDEENERKQHNTAVALERLKTLAGFDADTGVPLRTKVPEDKVVEWVSDKHVRFCKGCMKEFMFLLVRKHHCRLCGNVFCADCLAVGTPFALIQHTVRVRDGERLVGDARACPSCNESVRARNRMETHRRLLRLASDADTCQLLQKYEEITALRGHIDAVVPEYETAVVDLKACEAASDPEAVAYRRSRERRSNELQGEVVKLFRKLEELGVAADQLPCDSERAKRVQRNIHAAVSIFVTEMFALRKSLSSIKPP